MKYSETSTLSDRSGSGRRPRWRASLNPSSDLRCKSGRTLIPNRSLGLVEDPLHSGHEIDQIIVCRVLGKNEGGSPVPQALWLCDGLLYTRRPKGGVTLSQAASSGGRTVVGGLDQYRQLRYVPTRPGPVALADDGRLFGLDRGTISAGDGPTGTTSESRPGPKLGDTFSQDEVLAGPVLHDCCTSLCP